MQCFRIGYIIFLKGKGLVTSDLFRHLRIHTREKRMDEKIISKQMKELDERQQLLVIAMEECGEMIQACSKALRRGELYDHSDSETELKKEVGDVYAMIELLVEWDVLSWDEIENRRDVKRRKLSRWSDLISVSESKLYEQENTPMDTEQQFSIDTEEEYVEKFGGWRGGVTGK